MLNVLHPLLLGDEVHLGLDHPLVVMQRLYDRTGAGWEL